MPTKGTFCYVLGLLVSDDFRGLDRLSKADFIARLDLLNFYSDDGQLILCHLYGSLYLTAWGRVLVMCGIVLNYDDLNIKDRPFFEQICLSTAKNKK